MLTLLLALACAGHADPPVSTSPPPSADAPQALSLRSVRLECGKNDGVVLTVRAASPGGADLELELPSRAAPGPLVDIPTWIYLADQDAKLVMSSGTVDASSAEHLRATFEVPGPGGAQVLSVDAGVEDLVGRGCELP